MKLQSCYKDPVYFKCASPQKTIEKIKQGFERIGVEAVYRPYDFKRRGAPHWGGLSLNHLNFSTTGKGITSRLSEASAYAEMAERISCRLNLRKYDLILKKDYGKKNDLLHKFFNVEYLNGHTYAHQRDIEKKDNILSIERILQNSSFKKSDIEFIKKGEIARHWVNGYSLSEERDVKIPLLFIKNSSTSSGLASGNTLEEAIVQGSNEIFERYTVGKIMSEKMIVPTLDVSAIDNPNLKRLLSFYNEISVEVIFKDFSLGKGLPCVGALFVNKNLANSGNPIKETFYYTRFGAASSFNTEEALIRCLTEGLQGYTLEDVEHNYLSDFLWQKWFLKKDIDYIPPKDDPLLLGIYLTKDNLEFMKKGKVIKLKKNKPERKDCLEEIDQVKKICKNYETELIVVNQTHPVLSFPTVRVIMPGISDVLSFYQNKSKEAFISFDSQLFKEYINDNGWCSSKKKIEKLILKVENLINVLPIKQVVVSRTLGFNNNELNLIELLAFLYWKTGQREKLVLSLNLLRLFYLRYEEEYRYLLSMTVFKQDNILKREFEVLPGCRRYLVSEPLRNPLTSWCDKPCKNQCEEKYRGTLFKVIKTFFVEK